MKAKLFTNGRSQAVRLPAAFRFKGSEVYIRKDPNSGEVILSAKPADWEAFLAARDLDDSDTVNFMSNRDNDLPQNRELF